MWRGLIDFAAKAPPILLALFAAGSIGHARDIKPTSHQIAQRYSRPFLICGEEHPDEGDGFEVCEAQELARQNSALNLAYRKAVGRMSVRVRADLARAQRQWSVDSGKHCHERAADRAKDESYAGCMIDETIRRTLWLEHLR